MVLCMALISLGTWYLNYFNDKYLGMINQMSIIYIFIIYYNITFVGLYVILIKKHMYFYIAVLCFILFPVFFLCLSDKGFYQNTLFILIHSIAFTSTVALIACLSLIIIGGDIGKKMYTVLVLMVISISLMVISRVFPGTFLIPCTKYSKDYEERAFNKISKGMSTNEVIELLGYPLKKEQRYPYEEIWMYSEEGCPYPHTIYARRWIVFDITNDKAIKIFKDVDD